MMPLDELLARFQADLLRQGRQPETVQAYGRDVRRFAAWFTQTYGAAWDPAATTPQHGHAYGRDLHHRGGLQPASVNRLLAGLRTFLEWATTAGYLPANPLRRVHGLALRPPTPTWLERPEQERLLAALEQAAQAASTAPPAAREQTLRERALLLTLFYTGIAARDLVHLTLADLTLADHQGVLRVPLTGRRRPARTLPLPAPLCRALQDYLAVRRPTPSARLFVGRRGPLGPRQVRRILQKWAARAGLPPGRLTAQALRQTCAYNLLQAGVPLLQVAARLGCSDLNTLRPYLAPPTAAAADLPPERRMP